MPAAVAGDLETYWLQERCGYSAKKVKDDEAFMLNRIGGRMSGAGYNDLFKCWPAGRDYPRTSRCITCGTA